MALKPSSAAPASGNLTRKEPGPPLPRIKFAEHPVPGKPESDRHLILDDGTELRERLSRAGAVSENVHTAAEQVAPTSYSVRISLALLEADGSVKRDRAGAAMIAPVHEVALKGEALARLGSVEAIEAAIADAREVAAALARDHFAGIALGEKVLGARLAAPRQQKEAE
jgi:hypothetical protein